MKTLILYATHIIHENLIYFINNGYFNDNDYDFYFIFNCPNLDVKFNTTNTNIHVVVRENKGMDFGAWSSVLLSEKDGKKLYTYYDYFIFLNYTVIGPLLPLYVTEKWTDIFQTYRQ